MIIALLDCLGVMPAVVATIMNTVYGYGNPVTNLHRLLQGRSISDAFWSSSNTLVVTLAIGCANLRDEAEQQVDFEIPHSGNGVWFCRWVLAQISPGLAKNNIWLDTKHRYKETGSNIYKDTPAYQNLYNVQFNHRHDCSHSDVRWYPL